MVTEVLEEEVLSKNKITKVVKSKEKTNHYKRHCFTPNEILYNYYQTN